jgi:hypothetical protein
MIICLTGMHRSGTSLMASYFKACGIPMGENLKTGSVGNDHGHFEDMEYLEFHKDIIRRHKTNMYFPGKHLSMNSAELDYGKKLLIERNTGYETWGWKEPRTTLFLQDWYQLDEDIKYVFMYRHPIEVIRSLYKRKDRWLYIRPWLAPLAWLHHNQILIDFHKRYKNKSILVGINGFNNKPEEYEKILSSFLGVDFNKPYSTVYKPKSISKQGEGKLTFPFNLYYKSVINHYKKQLLNIYDELNELALIRDNG